MGSLKHLELASKKNKPNPLKNLQQRPFSKSFMHMMPEKITSMQSTGLKNIQETSSSSLTESEMTHRSKQKKLSSQLSSSLKSDS